MSLAEDLRRPYEATTHRLPTTNLARKPAAEIRPKAVEPMVREPVRDLRKEPAAPQSLPPIDTSLDLLDRASKGVVMILARYKQLEDHVKQLEAWSKAQIQAAETASARWQEAALEAEKQVDGLKTTLDQVTRQSEAAQQAMQRDKEALTFLQDRIIASFGFGSEAHDAIKSVGLD